MTKRRTDFADFEEARRLSGLFFDRLLVELDITERTYYRWKECGQVPHWAMRIVELLSGDLSAHGWKHWRITSGVLTTDQLNSRYHRWTPGKLLKEIYSEPATTMPGEAANEAESPESPFLLRKARATQKVPP